MNPVPIRDRPVPQPLRDPHQYRVRHRRIERMLRTERFAAEGLVDEGHGRLQHAVQRGFVMTLQMPVLVHESVQKQLHRPLVRIELVEQRKEPQQQLAVFLPCARFPEDGPPVPVPVRLRQVFVERAMVDARPDLLRAQRGAGRVETFEDHVDAAVVVPGIFLPDDDRMENRIVEAAPVLVLQSPVGQILELFRDPAKPELLSMQEPVVEEPQRLQPLLAVDHHQPLRLAVLREKNGRHGEPEQERFDEPRRLRQRPDELPLERGHVDVPLPQTLDQSIDRIIRPVVRDPIPDLG